MQADPGTETQPGEHGTGGRYRFNLTADELMQLGLFRVGYVTRAASGRGGGDIIVHGANGLPIATVDNIDRALDLADHLGLALVQVH